MVDRLPTCACVTPIINPTLDRENGDGELE
jgi:hypothetical protein